MSHRCIKSEAGKNLARGSSAKEWISILWQNKKMPVESFFLVRLRKISSKQNEFLEFSWVFLSFQDTEK